MRHVEVTDDTIRVQLENVSPLTRVHVFATRFDPAFPAYGILSERSPSGADMAHRARRRIAIRRRAAISATNIATSSTANSPTNIRATCSSGPACC